MVPERGGGGMDGGGGGGGVDGRKWTDPEMMQETKHLLCARHHSGNTSAKSAHVWRCGRRLLN